MKQHLTRPEDLDSLKINLKNLFNQNVIEEFPEDEILEFIESYPCTIDINFIRVKNEPYIYLINVSTLEQLLKKESILIYPDTLVIQNVEIDPDYFIEILDFDSTKDEFEEEIPFDTKGKNSIRISITSKFYYGDLSFDMWIVFEVTEENLKKDIRILSIDIDNNLNNYSNSPFESSHLSFNIKRKIKNITQLEQSLYPILTEKIKSHLYID